MQAVVKEMGGQGRPLFFAHANGYPPGSYRPLFDALGDRFRIAAVEHRPLWGDREPPRNLSWDLFAKDMLTALEDQYDEPVWVVGHSMGGTAAILAAALEPKRFAGLILLDPVLLPRRVAWASRFTSERRLQKLPMIRRALGRPETFPSHAEAFDFYRPKRAFQGLSDEALRHYVEASKTAHAGVGVVLRYPKRWEAAVYASPPWVRKPLRSLTMPTLGLRGADSDTLSPKMLQRWRHWQPSATLEEVAGGHLFPLEHPRATAQRIIAYVSANNSA